MSTVTLTLEDCSELLRTAVGPDIPITPEMASRLNEGIRQLLDTAAATLHAAKKKRRAPEGTCTKCRQSMRETPYCPKDGEAHSAWNESGVGLTTTSPPAATNTADVLPPPPTDYYAVARGTRVGVVTSLSECVAVTKGVPGALHRKFDTLAAAEAYILANKKKPDNLVTLDKFGFVKKTKDVCHEEPLERRSLFFHEFEDNDVHRTMSERWRALQRAPPTEYRKMWGLGQFANVDESVTMIPAVMDSCPLESFVTSFQSNAVAMMRLDVGTTGFDPELLVTVFCDDGREEYETRPAFYGSHNKNKEAWRGLCCPLDKSISPQVWVDDYDDSADEWEDEPEDAESCASKASSQGDKMGGGGSDDDDMTDFLDEDEAAGLLGDRDDEEGEEVGNEELNAQLAQEAEQINQKKRRRTNCMAMVPKAAVGEAAAASVKALWDVPPDGSAYPDLESFFAAIASARVVERKSVEKMYFRPLEVALVVTSTEPTLPSTMSAETLHALVGFISNSVHSKLKKEILIYEFLKAHPDVANPRRHEKDVKVAVGIIATFTMKTGWVLKTEYAVPGPS